MSISQTPFYARLTNVFLSSLLTFPLTVARLLVINTDHFLPSHCFSLSRCLFFPFFLFESLYSFTLFSLTLNTFYLLSLSFSFTLFLGLFIHSPPSLSLYLFFHSSLSICYFIYSLLSLSLSLSFSLLGFFSSLFSFPLFIYLLYAFIPLSFSFFICFSFNSMYV